MTNDEFSRLFPNFHRYSSICCDSNITFNLHASSVMRSFMSFKVNDLSRKSIKLFCFNCTILKFSFKIVCPYWLYQCWLIENFPFSIQYIRFPINFKQTDTHLRFHETEKPATIPLSTVHPNIFYDYRLFLFSEIWSCQHHFHTTIFDVGPCKRTISNTIIYRLLLLLLMWQKQWL